MTSLHVIYGLALPPIQTPGYAYALNHVQYAYQIPSTSIVKFCIGGRFCSLNQLYKKSSGNDIFPSPKLNEDQKQEKGLRRKLKSFYPEIR